MHRRTLLAATVFAGITRTARAARPPAVLELFTSQGCSSCPPADRLLGRLIQRPGVIALAWHVDYWDRLGWRDPFSSRQATARQQAYARNLGTEVFTPALVVGGLRMAVGSDVASVEAAMAIAPVPPLAVELVRTPEGFAAEVGRSGQTVSALAAYYLPEHTTQIGAGENGGRQLTEYRIVREVRELGTWDGSVRRFDLPASSPGHGVVVLVQSVKLEVLGAAELPPRAGHG
jgi:hypothetical protein